MKDCFLDEDTIIHPGPSSPGPGVWNALHHRPLVRWGSYLWDFCLWVVAEFVFIGRGSIVTFGVLGFCAAFCLESLCKIPA